MICGLTVFHQAKVGESPAFVGLSERGAGLTDAGASWRLDTCQRSLVVTQRDSSREEAGEIAPGVDVFHGSDAYGFLLQVATGLASQLAGETNILGQMKAAWGQHTREFPWVQWLFADAKEIRAQFLSQVGGASYGSLTRQLLRNLGGPVDGPVLVIGAGDMAESVAPWLRAWPVEILNRTEAKAEALAQKLRAEPGASVTVVSPADAEQAWKRAGAIVFCVPFDQAEDVQRLEWLRALTKVPPVPVIHLGGHRHQAGDWNSLPLFRCLDDVYALQQQADGRRERQIALAMQACAERARHRGLGTSLSHPHGWEDLPAFFPWNGLRRNRASAAAEPPQSPAGEWAVCTA